MGKEQDLPGAIHERLCLANCVIRWRTNDRSVQTLFPGDSANVFEELRISGVENTVCSKVSCHFQPLMQQVSGQNPVALQTE